MGPGKNATSHSGAATIAELAGAAPRHPRTPVRQLRRADPVPALQAQI